MRNAFSVGCVLAALLALGCQSYTPVLPGDLDRDGRITRKDLDAMKALITAGGYQKEADLNGDGKVDAADQAELEKLLCQKNGGEITQSGACCVVAGNGTVCCDPEFDGQFSDCQPPDINCQSAADCDALNCPAYCGADGKCHCQGMCSQDEDCIFLNCPARCNEFNRCECKIPCARDEECLFIEHCPSVCDEARGFCVCGDDCLPEGAEFATGDPTGMCCPGTDPIPLEAWWQGACYPLNRANYVCAKCGNHVCGPGENPCNCVVDCPECQAGETKMFICPNGKQVPWCTCENGSFHCIKTPEAQCVTECRGLGEHFTVDSENPDNPANFCCADLERVADCTPVLTPDGRLDCSCPRCLCFVCVEAGDQSCGLGENFCNSPQDCPVPECKPGERVACACQNQYVIQPDCFECGNDGKWHDILYFADPCDCRNWPHCTASQFCDTQTGVCRPLAGCEPGATRSCDCQNLYQEQPACYRCNMSGEWERILWEFDPCLCSHGPPCAQGLVCNPQNDLCEPDCRLDHCAQVKDELACLSMSSCWPGYVGLCDCTCPGSNGYENGGCAGCPRECFQFAACIGGYSCWAGETCDSASGVCQTSANCLTAGQTFESFDTQNRCCPGLDPISVAVADTTGCAFPNCPCYVCSDCGNGTCESAWENRCNCAADCVGFQNCRSSNCRNVSRSYFVTGDCPGIPSGTTVYLPVRQDGCALAFTEVLASVLGEKACLDADVVFTEKGCTGWVNPIMASITISFTCPVNDPGTPGRACRVLLDDGID